MDKTHVRRMSLLGLVLGLATAGSIALGGAAGCGSSSSGGGTTHPPSGGTQAVTSGGLATINLGDKVVSFVPNGTSINIVTVESGSGSALQVGFKNASVPITTTFTVDSCAADATDLKVICQRGYTTTVRHVPPSLKNQVLRQYGISYPQPHEYEIDHLISLELGGSNSLRNLWPQSYLTQPLNARVKDRLENRLHALVCAGKLSLPVAQQAIATDWVAAYQQYVGPLPQDTHSHPTESADSSPSSAATAPVIGSGPQAPVEGSCPATAPIKVTKTGVYHLPGDPYYGRSKAVQCFATSEAAHAAGFRASQR